MMSLRVVPFRSVAVQAIRLLSSTGIVLIALDVPRPPVLMKRATC